MKICLLSIELQSGKESQLLSLTPSALTLNFVSQDLHLVLQAPTIVRENWRVLARKQLSLSKNLVNKPFFINQNVLNNWLHHQ